MARLEPEVVIFVLLCCALAFGMMVLLTRPKPCPKCGRRRGFRLLDPPELVDRLNPEMAGADPWARLQAEIFYGIQTYAECKACEKIVVRRA